MNRYFSRPVNWGPPPPELWHVVLTHRSLADAYVWKGYARDSLSAERSARDDFAREVHCPVPGQARALIVTRAGI